MIVVLVIFGTAFCWLLYETRYLTIQLPFGKPCTGDVLLRELLPLVFAWIVKGTIMRQYNDRHRLQKARGTR